MNQRTLLGGIAFTLPKKAESNADCQDAIAWNLDEQVFAVADGVGTSFLPGAWSSALVRGFVEKPPRGKDFAGWHQVAGEVWSQRIAEAAAQGDVFTRRRIRQNHTGCATFVGVRVQSTLRNEIQVDLWACGDACALVIEPNGRCTDSFPLTDTTQFGDTPPHLSSVDGAFEGKLGHRVLHLRHDQTLVLATDALAKWMLHTARQEPRRLQSAMQTTESEQFADLVAKERERAEGRLENDDVALLRLTICADSPAQILDYRAKASTAPPAIQVEPAGPARANSIPSAIPALEHAVKQLQAQAEIGRRRTRRRLVTAAAGVTMALAAATVLAVYLYSADQRLDALQRQTAELSREIDRKYAGVQNSTLQHIEQLRLEVPDRTQVQADLAKEHEASAKAIGAQNVRLASLEIAIGQAKNSLANLHKARGKDFELRKATEENLQKQLRQLAVSVSTLEHSYEKLAQECPRLSEAQNMDRRDD